MLIDPDASSEQLTEQLRTELALEKHIVVLRFDAEFMPVFVDVTLPAGQAAGALIKNEYIYSSSVEEILRLYDEWLEQHAQ